jgi:hypothetical protein
MFDMDLMYKAPCPEARRNPDGECGIPDEVRDTWKDHYTDYCPDCYRPGQQKDEKPGCCIIL